MRWTRFSARTTLSAGALELATGVAVCVGLVRVLAGIAMAAQGAIFSGLLAYTRRNGVAGDCGCLGWRDSAYGMTWRGLARAGWVLAAGLLDLTVGWPGPSGLTRPWSAAGTVGGGIVVTLLSVNLPYRTPSCNRRLWYPRRDTLDALTRHAVFAAMAAAAGPLGKEFAYRRVRCSEEFWFPATLACGPARQALVFRVTHAPGGGLAVHACWQDGVPAAARRRALTGSMARRLAPDGDGTPA